MLGAVATRARVGTARLASLDHASAQWSTHVVGSLLTHAGHHRRPNLTLRPGRIRIEPRPRELTVTRPIRVATDAPRVDRSTVSFSPIRMRLPKTRPMTCPPRWLWTLDRAAPRHPRADSGAPRRAGCWRRACPPRRPGRQRA